MRRKLGAGALFVDVLFLLAIFIALFFRGATSDVFWYPIALAFIFILVLCLVFWDLNLLPAPQLSGLEPYLLIWMGILILSALLSAHRWQTIPALERVIVALMVFYLSLWLFPSRSERKLLIWSLFAMPVLISFIGLLAYFSESELFFPIPENFILVRGTLVNHNNFAGLVLLGSFLGLGLLFGMESKRQTLATEDWAKRILLLLPLLILILALGFSLSRSGWLCFLFALLPFLLWLWLSRSKEKTRRYIQTSLAFLILASILLVIMEKGAIRKRAKTIEEFFKEPQTGLTVAGRIKIWKSAILMIQDHPFFGIGPGTYWIEYPKYRQKGELHGVRHAHNDLLELCAETGLFSTAIFIILAVKAVSLIRRNYKKTPSPRERRICLGIIFGIIAFFVQDLVDFHFHIPGLVYYFLALVGFLFKPKR